MANRSKNATWASVKSELQQMDPLPNSLQTRQNHHSGRCAFPRVVGDSIQNIGAAGYDGPHGLAFTGAERAQRAREPPKAASGATPC